jgi:peptidoglycan/xylan/chitin deacetylase (PgdA/CDA1 family)
MIPWRLRAAIYRLAQARRIDASSRHGMVSFTFDDFPRSALATGGSILAARRLAGTYYTAAGLADSAGPMGPMFSASDLAVCARDGHEIGAHTFAHIGVAGLATRDLLSDIERSNRALAPFAPRNFSYPMGRTDLTVAAVLGRYFDSCRGIEAGLNGAATDLNFLKAVALYAQQPAELFLDYIAEARRQGAWLIFYTHDVSDSPSPFGCSITLFEQIVAAAQRSGAQVAPVRDCLAELPAPREIAGAESVVTA